MRESAGGALAANVIAHGTRSGAAPRGSRSTAPSAEPAVGGAPLRRATRRTTVDPPGLSRTCAGTGVISRPPAPAFSIRTRSFRDETLRRTRCCVACQPSPCARPNASEPGSAETSAVAAAPASTRPPPCSVTLVPASGSALPASRLFRSTARRSGRSSASSAATPVTTAAAALVPLTVPKRAEPSSLRPGSAVASTTPGATRSGFTRASKASPCDENGAIPPSDPLGKVAGRPIEATASRPRLREAITARATRSGMLMTGMPTLSSRPRPPAGSETPWTTTARAPACGRVLDGEPRVAPGRDEGGAAGDEADAFAVEVVRERGRGPRSRLPRSGQRELERARRGDRAGERQLAVEQELQPGSNHDGHLLDARAQVGGADGQRGRRAARAGDAAVAGAGRPVVAGGCDDERVQLESSLHRPRLRRVGERRIRRRDADEGDPGRVMSVAVKVRVDSALEAGDQLVGPRVNGPLARLVELPARDPDRQDGGAGRHSRDPAGPTRADEQAGHLGAVVFATARVARIRDGRRAAPHLRVDDVDAVLDPPAQVRGAPSRRPVSSSAMLTPRAS